MITKFEAEALVQATLRDLERGSGVEFMIAEDATREASFGWIFYFNSKLFLQTGVNKYRLAGNGPIFVNKETSEVRVNGPRPNVDTLIAAYEKELSAKHSSE